jgi:hypothetical protein
MDKAGKPCQQEREFKVVGRKGCIMPNVRARRGMTGITVADLEAELGRRRKNLTKLEARYARLQKELADLGEEITTLGGSVHGPGGRRRRARNAQTLVAALEGVLDGKTMSVTDAAEAVQQAGYVTTSPSFRTIVNQTLINSGKFKRVGRGQYTLK